MTTSGTTNASLTAGDIIDLALGLHNIADSGNTDAANKDVALKHLNWMLKSMQADGCNLWRDETITMIWPADTSEGSLDPSVIDLIHVRHEVSSTLERPLSRIERGQYMEMPNKAQTGDPLLYTVIKRTGDIRMAVWPVPAFDVTLNCNVARVIEDVTGLTQTLDLPQEWTEAVIYNLADRLTLPFQLAGNRESDRITARAASLYSLLRDADRPGSYTLTR